MRTSYVVLLALMGTAHAALLNVERQAGKWEDDKQMAEIQDVDFNLAEAEDEDEDFDFGLDDYDEDFLAQTSDSDDDEGLAQQQWGPPPRGYVVSDSAASSYIESRLSRSIYSQSIRRMGGTRATSDTEKFAKKYADKWSKSVGL